MNGPICFQLVRVSTDTFVLFERVSRKINQLNFTCTEKCVMVTLTNISDSGYHFREKI